MHNLYHTLWQDVKVKMDLPRAVRQLMIRIKAIAVLSAILHLLLFTEEQ